jgi:hypothetical protein
MSSPVGTPPSGLHGPELTTASPLYLPDLSLPMPVQACGVLHVWWAGATQPSSSNVDTVPPLQSMFGGSHEQAVHPRVSVAAP